MKATNLAELYDSPLVDWTRIATRLDQGLDQAPQSGGPNRHTCWLATINADSAHMSRRSGPFGSMGPSGSRREAERARGATSPATLVAR
jgi:hypothetical protein